MKALSAFRRQIRGLRWLYGRFGDLVHAERTLLLGASLAMIGEVLFLLLVPWPIKYVTDGLLIPSPDEPLWGVPDGFAVDHPHIFVAAVSVALVIVVVAGQSCAYSRRILAATAGQHMVLKLRKRVFHHLQRLPLAFHDQSRHGDLILRLTGDVPVLRDVLSDAALELIGRLVTVVVLVAIMLWIDTPLALVSVGVVLGLGLLSAWFTRRITQVVRGQRKKESAVAFAAAESLRAVALIKSSNRESEVTRRFARQNRSSLRAGIKGTKLQAGLVRWIEVLFSLGTASVLGLGVLRVLDPSSGFTAGDLLLFLSYTRNLNKPLRKSARLGARIGKAVACGERLVELLRVDPESSEGRALEAAPREVRCDHLGFSYPDAPPTLRDVHFAIAPGERVALVGPNGAGKSTLIKLLLRLYEPTEGSISLDGMPFRDLSISSVREHLTWVPQESMLFGDTVDECLEFVAPDSTRTERRHALSRVDARFALDDPGGIHRELSEGGRNLSGGQRRKLVLAGAVLQGSPVVVLDEPTTHVDERSRLDLLERLPSLFEGSTLLIVSHDPALVEAMDRVIFLDGGRVAGDDTHQRLCKRNEAYRALFAMEAER